MQQFLHIGILENHTYEINFFADHDSGYAHDATTAYQDGKMTFCFYDGKEKTN